MHIYPSMQRLLENFAILHKQAGCSSNMLLVTLDCISEIHLVQLLFSRISSTKQSPSHFLLRERRLQLLLERLQVELECGARVRDLELLQHGGVQDAEHADLEVVGAVERGLERALQHRQPGRVLRRPVVDRCRASREEGRVWTDEQMCTSASALVPVQPRYPRLATRWMAHSSIQISS